jgi:hypothetical protein
LYIHPEDFYNDPEGEGLDLDLDSGNKDLQEEAINKYLLADFKAFMRQRPGVDFTACANILNSLGNREINRLYN